MASIEEMRILKQEIADTKRFEAEDLQAKIATLSSLQIADLLSLKEHWTQEFKRHRFLDDETQAKRQEAARWLKAIDLNLRDPRPAQAGVSPQQTIHAATVTGTPLKAFVEEYLKHVKSDFAKGTHENAERALTWFKEHFGEKDLGTFTAEDLETFKAQRKQAGLSNATINIDVRTIKAAFSVARKWKRIAENPFEEVKQLRVDQKAKRILSEEEFGKILEAIKERWLRDIIAFNVLTGLRLGEIMDLKWTDYDVVKNEITVQSSSEYRVKGGKMRVIPVGIDAATLLDARPKTSEWIFVGNKGKKYTGDYVSKKFKEYIRQLKLPEELHYHRLRDTYCTWLAEKNVPIHIIKALAGHSSVRVTEGYISANTDLMKSEVAKLHLPPSPKKKPAPRKKKLD